MSTHRVDVVEIKEVLPHPNADKLELIPVNGYTCVVKKGEWKPGDKAAYIEPDYVVPDVPDYSFLLGKRRIGAKRLRGVWSEGLLVKAPEGANVGEDVLERLGITRWEPPTDGHGGGNSFRGPPLGCLEAVPDSVRRIPVYDLENLRKYSHLFRPGELVDVTEKLHGTNARYVVHDGVFYAGSRSQWRKSDPRNVYWDCVDQNQWIKGWCLAHPDMVLWGEIFGDVQDMNYGMQKGQYEFRVFDMYSMRMERFMPTYNVHMNEKLRAVPHCVMPFDLDKLKEFAERDSAFGGIKEGLVVSPVEERTDPRIGRVKLKLVSNRYLSR